MVKLQRFSEKKSLIHEFGKFILEKQDSALTGDADAVFNIAISGGSMNQALYESLVNDKTFFHILSGHNGESSSVTKDWFHLRIRKVTMVSSKKQFWTR